MNAQIEITKITAWTLLGALPEERLRRRPVVITLSLWCDIARPAETDALCDAIDYSHVRDAVVACVESSADRLLERLAARIVDVVLSFDGVSEATVKVEKPNALDNCESVAVIMTRQCC